MQQAPPLQDFRGRLQELRAQVCRGSAGARLAAAREVRQLLSVLHDPPIDDVIGADLVRPLVALLGRWEDPHLQH